MQREAFDSQDFGWHDDSPTVRSRPQTSIITWSRHFCGWRLRSLGSYGLVVQDLSGYSSKADIYSVGATLCEMANGFPPFGDMNRLEMLYEKSRGTTPRLLDSTTLPSFEVLQLRPLGQTLTVCFLILFLKKTRKSLIDLMPLAQKLEQVQRVSGKTNTVEEKYDVPEWIF
ncbi:hypothetical protein ANCDUO_26251 [Ancylostoma duodenale]|uniref:Protein kinase domain-containing protein n=1 Tax=Ancylostoma duodenale TaxID=51022 RepID=A0A0C2C2B3_9BILA|nr:hypothetical protein ANCDUO_26251 [Ancylostoma duodenale]